MSIITKIKRFLQKNAKVLGITTAVAIAAGAGAAALGNASASPVSTRNCDSNAVIYCGAESVSELVNKYNNGDSHNKVYTIHDIYNWFGISPSDVNSMSGDVTTGYVTKSGDVYSGNTLVATNALTGGRENIAGSTKEKYGATSFYVRQPSVSFLDDQLKAFVVMKNGVFQFAVLYSCGNAVKATPKMPPKPPTPKPPVPKPATLTCDDLTLTPGAVDSNGNQNYILEAQASTANGATISSYDFNFGDGNSKSVSTSNSSASTPHTYAPGTYTASVTVHGTGNGGDLTGSSDNCMKSLTVKIPTPPQGSLVCDDLTLTPGMADAQGNVPYTLEAQATPSAQETTIQSYTFNFGDSSQPVTVNTGANSASTPHTYAPGNWTASVTVNGTVNGRMVNITSANCSKEVKVGKPPVTPVLVCGSLTLSPVGQADAQGNLKYTLVATASASNATIQSYTFNFGDSSQDLPVNTSDVSTSTTHTYAPGTYTAAVSVTGTLNDNTQKTVTSQNCQAKITVPAPTCTSATGQTYPANSNQCQTCTSPSGQVYPVNSAQCTPTTPTSPSAPASTTLPNTGPGDVLGLFSGVSMSGAGIHRIIGNRRARRAVRQ